MSPKSAIEHYVAALPYRNTIVRIRLESLETDRPPHLFEYLFRRAPADGFKITCHCDVGDKGTPRNIGQVVEKLGGTGAHRIDYGLHAVDDSVLLQRVKDRNLGMTICPWGYLCYSGESNIMDRIRALYDAGPRLSPEMAYLEDIWLNHSLYLLPVDICWAFVVVKMKILEVERFRELALESGQAVSGEISGSEGKEGVVTI
ncbi:hypothetical protein EYZ11_004486 [Aspergillus tanneri]|uniref:Adenosine deaminase domain-containing protein n=1 Tax=Aspergillus tanneri TaxID=1220188 RepID=A0A4S3JKG2_9EURO|nr:hypothetical protein EYZ11_004486 [Aspergillus tanneri]